MYQERATKEEILEVKLQNERIQRRAQYIGHHLKVQELEGKERELKGKCQELEELLNGTEERFDKPKHNKNQCDYLLDEVEKKVQHLNNRIREKNGEILYLRGELTKQEEILAFYKSTIERMDKKIRAVMNAQSKWAEQVSYEDDSATSEPVIEFLDE